MTARNKYSEHETHALAVIAEQMPDYWPPRFRDLAELTSELARRLAILEQRGSHAHHRGNAMKNSDDDEIRFLEGDGDQSGDRRSAILAVCILHQQRAGFKNVIDLRQTDCPKCGAPGFNSGWGFWWFACGAELLSDGEVFDECQDAEAALRKEMVG